MALAGTVLGEKPPNKRMKTVDHFLDSLTLRAADPPGHSSKSVRDVESNEMGLHGVMHNPPTTDMKLATHNCIVPSNYAVRSTKDASTSCASTVTTTNKRPNLTDNHSFTQVQLQSKRQQQYSQRDPSTSGLSDTGNSEMSLEGSDIDDCSIDSSSSSGSVSESSIRNAMYQVVFGRRKGYGSCSGGGNCGGGRMYDVVDSKIEDLIRRSRMEALVKSCKEKEGKRKGHEGDDDDVERGMDLD